MMTKMSLLVLGVLLTAACQRAEIPATSSSPTLRADHVGVSVKNLDAQQAWYQKVFAMQVEQRFELPNPAVRTVLLRSPEGVGIELIERAGSSRSRAFTDALDASLSQGFGHWALNVANLEQIFTRLTTAGASVVSAPAPAVQAGARFAYVKDPEGNLIELIQSPVQ